MLETDHTRVSLNEKAAAPRLAADKAQIADRGVDVPRVEPVGGFLQIELHDFELDAGCHAL